MRISDWSSDVCSSDLAGRTLNARRPKTPREDTIQPAPAMITSRKHTRRIAMQAPLKLAALLLALAAVAMPATAAARDNDRGHRGHDRSSYYDRDRRGHQDRKSTRLNSSH